MIEILQDSLVPFTESIEPAIKLRLRERHNTQRILLKIEGSVFSEDGKFIAPLIELFSTKPNDETLSLKRIGDYNPSGDTLTEHDFAFTLTKQMTDYIETLREKNKKKDVVLKFTLMVSYVENLTRIGSYKLMQTNQVPGVNIVAIEQQNRNYGDQNLNIMVTDTNNNMLSIRTEIQDKSIQTIRASDWIQDFQRPLGIGKFLIVEVPEPESETVNLHGLTSDQKIFKERLDHAYKILPLMELDLRQGEWGTVVGRTRELLELFKKDVTQFIKQMISDTSSMTEEKAGDLAQSIDHLYAYANDLHHSVDKNGRTNEFFTGGKEDAYMAYLLCTSLVNLLDKKFRRVISENK